MATPTAQNHQPTTSSNNLMSENVSSSCEKTIKFLFHSKSQKTESDVAKSHKNTIKQFIQLGVSIFDRNDALRHNFPAQIQDCHQLFNFVPTVKIKNNKQHTEWTVAHRICTWHSASALRELPSMKTMLQQHQCELKTHLWPVDVTDLTTLCFFTAVDSVDTNRVDFETSVRLHIAEATNTFSDDVPLTVVAFKTLTMMEM
jgi:hypothetical protein